jgi:signal transduction histidine kinase
MAVLRFLRPMVARGARRRDPERVAQDIAHDLRTPLARLHGRLQALAASAPAAPVRAELEALAGQSAEILALFAAILRIAEVEGGGARAGFARIDLAALAQDGALALEAMVEESGRRLQIEAGPVPPIEGDTRLLTQALVNLVENAVHHTPAGTTITVSVARDGARARMTVRDDGPGIPAADRHRALRRFGRLEAAGERPGHGLGLALVAAIARLHGGTLRLADAGPGLAAHLALPLAR